MAEASKESLKPAEPVQAIPEPELEPEQEIDVSEGNARHLGKEPIASEIEFPDFARIDLRVALIANAELVDGADKLLKITLDLGLNAEGKPSMRTVFSGIKSAYKPEDLIGKLTVVVANLKARKMKFGLSEGMILAASDSDGKGIYLLEPFPGAEPGMRIT